MIADVTGVLLAGGKSRRMGEDKRFIPVGKRTLFERSCTVLREVFDDVCVVVAQDSPDLQAPVPVLRDLVRDCGSLGGLYTGLRQATTGHIFLAACDMPFLQADLIRYMVTLKENGEIVMPRWRNKLQPTHALYSQDCLPILEDMIRRRDIKIQDLTSHAALRVRWVTELEVSRLDPQGCSFLNINTPMDLDAARLLSADRERT